MFNTSIATLRLSFINKSKSHTLSIVRVGISRKTTMSRIPLFKRKVLSRAARDFGISLDLVQVQKMIKIMGLFVHLQSTLRVQWIISTTRPRIHGRPILG
jgi:hypothetical protein